MTWHHLGTIIVAAYLLAWAFRLGRAFGRGDRNAYRRDPFHDALIQVCLRYLEAEDGKPDRTARIMYQTAQACLNETPHQWWTVNPVHERSEWHTKRDMGPALKPNGEPME